MENIEIAELVKFNLSMDYDPCSGFPCMHCQFNSSFDSNCKKTIIEWSTKIILLKAKVNKWKNLK